MGLVWHMGGDGSGNIIIFYSPVPHFVHLLSSSSHLWRRNLWTQWKNGLPRKYIFLKTFSTHMYCYTESRNHVTNANMFPSFYGVASPGPHALTPYAPTALSWRLLWRHTMCKWPQMLCSVTQCVQYVDTDTDVSQVYDLIWIRNMTSAVLCSVTPGVQYVATGPDVPHSGTPHG